MSKRLILVVIQYIYLFIEIIVHFFRQNTQFLLSWRGGASCTGFEPATLRLLFEVRTNEFQYSLHFTVYELASGLGLSM